MSPPPREEEDLVPLPVARVSLLEFVVLMQKGYPERLAAWSRCREEASFSEDVHRFLHSDIRESSSMESMEPKPKPFYLNVDEIEALAFETLEKWRRGEYRYVMQSQARILRTAVRLWLKAIGKPQAPPPESKAPTHRGRRGRGAPAKTVETIAKSRASIT